MPDWSRDLGFGLLCLSCSFKNVSLCPSCQLICWKLFRHKALKGVKWTPGCCAAIRSRNGMEGIKDEVLELPHPPLDDLTVKIKEGSKGVL